MCGCSPARKAFESLSCAESQTRRHLKPTGSACSQRATLAQSDPAAAVGLDLRYYRDAFVLFAEGAHKSFPKLSAFSKPSQNDFLQLFNQIF